MPHTHQSYCTVTDEIEVLVVPQFSEDRSSPEKGDYFWVYTVEIRNRSARTIQLHARHWQITDADGHVQHVRGLGVVGEQPVIKPGHAFRYSSGCPLKTSQGMMVGTYLMHTEDGEQLEIAIPAFSLDMPGVKRVMH